uniref:Uncharacterized protein n=1 Tax=Geladintestivirus 6 TaxID=3233138 RepID=A0AAU8MJ25_9CAUD
MKKTIIFLILSIMTICTYAQEFVAPVRKRGTQFTDTTTTYTYKCPEKTYNVYVSHGGAYYIWKISKKTNKSYKYYLPKEIQIKMGRKYEQK